MVAAVQKETRETWAKDPLVCMKCGSAEHLEIMMWVNPTTTKIDWTELPFDMYSDPQQSGITAAYCAPCKGDHGTALASQAAVAVALLATLGGG